ncbi:MAG: uncharacterized protein JWO98_471 [Frankiales bacterium]|nr:uncharacterized protein [Frankiales bacterium]
MTPAGRLLTAAVPLLLLAGCTSFADTVAARRTGPLHCPATRAAPDPSRPAVDLDLRLSGDLHTVTGTESVRFTPDRPTSELVFRLVPNGPGAASAGNRLTVDSVRGDDVTGGGYEADGAVGPGGLYRAGLSHRLAAGRTTRLVLRFTLTLGAGTFDRFGTGDGVAWWGSGAPLLAWEPGVGWDRDPFVGVQGETATSPAAYTRIRVSAPAALTVLMTGKQDPPTAPSHGRRTWTSAEPAARDVSVAVGAFTTRQGTTRDGVRVTVGILPGADLDADRLAQWTTAAITGLEKRLGPFPYRTLTVPHLGEYGGGIEYPSSIQLAAADRPVLVHEVAHMWFYGMVGDNQYRDPWLDEAFASYAEGLEDGTPDAEVQRVLERPGRRRRRHGRLPEFRGLLRRGLRQGRGRAAHRAPGCRYGGVRRGGALLRRRQSLDHRHACRRRCRSGGTARGRRRSPRGRRPAEGRRAALMPNRQPASPSSRCIRPTPSTRSSSPSA